MAKPDPMLRYLSPLVGATITTIIVEDGQDDTDETHYGFIIEKEGKRYDCMILADEEGNGPGHLDITENRRKGTKELLMKTDPRIISLEELEQCKRDRKP